jgi:hypothetical protein
MMAESESRRIKNALVSTTFKFGSDDDIKLISRLFVHTGNLGKLSTSDVWQHFGLLFRKYTTASANV